MNSTGTLAALLLWFSYSATAGAQEPLQSKFACREQNGGWRPYYLQAIDGGSRYRDYSQTARGLLGQNLMRTLDECESALSAAENEHGVICSRTGLDGWKPTLYTGTVPGRADFGYMGGSSIMNFADCLTATRHASAAGVCYWGGSDWYVSPIDRAGTIKGPFRTIDRCIDETTPG